MTKIQGFKRHVFEVHVGDKGKTKENLKCNAKAFEFSPVSNRILLKVLELWCDITCNLRRLLKWFSAAVPGGLELESTWTKQSN